MTTLSPDRTDVSPVRSAPRLALFATAAAQFALMFAAFGVLSRGWLRRAANVARMRYSLDAMGAALTRLYQETTR